MFGETRFFTPYFQQMTFHSKIRKIFHSVPKMNWSVNYFGVEYELFLERNVNYFDHVGGRVFFFLKIKCVKCNFTINLEMLV